MSRLEQARSRLADRYCRSLRAKIEGLATAGDAFVGGDTEAASAIRRMAHQLTGSGASFGFPRISESAALAEQATDACLPEALAALMEVLEEISASVESNDVSKLLIIEDDQELSELLVQSLELPQRSIEQVASIGDAWLRLEKESFDLVVLDLSLPDGDGRNLLAEMQDHPRTADTPVVVLSATQAGRVKTECLALGAEQYFDKPIDEDFLSAAISGVLDRRRRHKDEVRIDALTGLANRVGFRDAFTSAIKLGDRAALPLALAIIDLDHFKKLNDSFGHNFGDEVLRRLGAILASALRESDFSARWGGEEFVVLFQNTDARTAVTVLGKLQERLRSERLQPEGQSPQTVTFSGGVVDVRQGEEMTDAVARADELLYAAKSAGRDRVVDSPPEGGGAASTRILYAEDDDDVASIVMETLREGGFDVFRYPDGRAALRAAIETPHDFAILDKDMPEMDGFELLSKLRADKNYESIPILMLTSVGREAEIERAFTLGADDYVQKPFKPRELMARVNRLARRTAVRA